jgi:hypothetical protein
MGKRCAGDVQWPAAPTMTGKRSEHCCTCGPVSGASKPWTPKRTQCMLQAKSSCCPGNPLGTAQGHAPPDTPRDGGKFRVC